MIDEDERAVVRGQQAAQRLGIAGAVVSPGVPVKVPIEPGANIGEQVLIDKPKLVGYSVTY